jgi:hypothetical protein
LSLRLGWSINVRNTHQFKELFALRIVLPGDTDGSSGKLLDVLRGPSFFGFFVGFMGLGFACNSFRKFTTLQLRRRTVKDIEGFDAIIHDAESSIEHSHEMRRGFAGLVHELLTVRAYGDQETVDTHGPI